VKLTVKYSTKPVLTFFLLARVNVLVVMGVGGGDHSHLY